MQEADVAVCLHGTQPITSRYAEWGAPSDNENYSTGGTYRELLLGYRDIQDTISGLLCEGTLTRIPRLRIGSVENGATWVGQFLKNMTSSANKHPKSSPEHPVEVFRRQVYLNPFWEEDIAELVELCGEGHVLYGSDYPHPEGMAEPRQFLSQLDGRPEPLVKRIVDDNVREFHRV